MPRQAWAYKILNEAPSSTIQRAILYCLTLTVIWKASSEGRHSSTMLSQSKEAIQELGGGWFEASSVPPCFVSSELVVKKMWLADTSLSKGRVGLIDNGIDSTALWNVTLRRESRIDQRWHWFNQIRITLRKKSGIDQRWDFFDHLINQRLSRLLKNYRFFRRRKSLSLGPRLLARKRGIRSYFVCIAKKDVHVHDGSQGRVKMMKRAHEGRTRSV